jgi:hypothetical protein
MAVISMGRVGGWSLMYLFLFSFSYPLIPLITTPLMK